MKLEPNEETAIARKCMRMKNSATTHEQYQVADRYGKLFMRRVIRDYHTPVTPGEKFLASLTIGFILTVAGIVALALIFGE